MSEIGTNKLADLISFYKVKLAGINDMLLAIESELVRINKSSKSGTLKSVKQVSLLKDSIVKHNILYTAYSGFIKELEVLV
jgi:hypothetical protein